jgi:hypothetical protein
MARFLLIAVYVLSIYFIYEVWKGTMERDKKILWTLVLLALPVVGVILYLAIGKKK